MRVLIIGGTRFIGPAAAARLSGMGHEVTVFHRGQTEADLPPEIAHIPQLRPPEGDYGQHLVADTSRIREELGYQEPVPRNEALRRTIEWERAHRPEGADKLFDYEAEDAVLAELGRDDR